MLNSLTGRLTVPGGKIFDRVLFCICYDILNFTASANKLNKHTLHGSYKVQYGIVFSCWLGFHLFFDMAKTQSKNPTGFKIRWVFLHGYDPKKPSGFFGSYPLA